MKYKEITGSKNKILSNNKVLTIESIKNGLERKEIIKDCIIKREFSKLRKIGVNIL